MATCSKCHKKEQPNDTDEMLLCDGCDLEIHVSCAGLTAVPKGDWLCEKCHQVLDARRKANSSLHHSHVPRDAEGVRSLRAQLPPLPKLDSTARSLGEKAEKRFKEEVTSRRDQALSQLLENQRVLEQSSTERIATLTSSINSQTTTVERETLKYNESKYSLCLRHGLEDWDWDISRFGTSNIKYVDSNGSTGTVYKDRYGSGCAQWNR